MFAAIVPIQQALDAFSRRVIEAGVDTRVILLSGAELCVAPPLGSGQCAAPSGGNMAGMSGMPMRNVPSPLGKPAADSREPVFLHLDTPFGADQGMVVLLDNYPGYKHLLRGNARTQLLITEDGVSPYATQAVIDHVEGRASATTMPAWMPGLSAKSWTFNGIVCQKGWGLGTCVAALQPPASTLELIDATGGLVADLMNVGVAGSDPFAQLLDKLAENVIVGAQVSCDYKIPAPPSGMSFDPEQVNVVYTDGDANEVTFPRTANMSPCDQHEAWHYDVPEAPESVRLCPAACERVQRDPAARVDVKFGCNTTVLSPS
jgi:hypothetical protein